MIAAVYSQKIKRVSQSSFSIFSITEHRRWAAAIAAHSNLDDWKL